jgi:hypothetical protein
MSSLCRHFDRKPGTRRLKEGGAENIPAFNAATHWQSVNAEQW